MKMLKTIFLIHIQLIKEKHMQSKKPADKISILFTIYPLPQTKNEQTSINYEFIYGIGTYGLCPLELLLHSKAVGDEFEISINTNNWMDLFGHLPAPNLEVDLNSQKLKIKVQIKSIAPAQNREVIKALSNLTRCQGGCGCGDH
jgi:hypothetical protein